jgi:hypothetical protein
VIISLLLPILAVEDHAVAEYGDKLGMRDSDVTCQLCPFQNFVWLKAFPEFDDDLGYICKERRRGEGEKSGMVCGGGIYSCIGLERVLLEESEDDPCMRRFWICREGIAKYGDSVVVRENVWFDETSTWDIMQEVLVN